MAAHNTLGKAGEDAAVHYLEGKGYEIVHRNWRAGHLEIDIVARKDGYLVMVEVKTRRNTRYQEPAEAVSPLKMKRILQATDAYLQNCESTPAVRFDIITAIGGAGHLRIEQIEDAWQPLAFCEMAN